MNSTNTIILTIHNKEKSILEILSNLLNNTSNYTKKIILIFDGCTDNSYEIVKNFLAKINTKINIEIIFTDDIWETKSNNIGLRMVTTKYATIVQDDMLIKQKNWDKKLIEKLDKHKIFAVSGRAAHDFKFIKNEINIVNLIGREFPLANENILGKFIGKIISLSKAFWIYKYCNIFAIRLTVNRGPLVLRTNLIKDLNYFDEKFAPFELDDIDLCCRAYKKFGLKSAVNPIYYKELNGSKKFNENSKEISRNSIIKNTILLRERHSDLQQ